MIAAFLMLTGMMLGCFAAAGILVYGLMAVGQFCSNLVPGPQREDRPTLPPGTGSPF